MPEFIDVTARGIPCTARIDRSICVEPWRGSPMTCPSADDYYGYRELEFTICDRNGREADWISCKMSDKDFEDVERQIVEAMRVDSEEYL